jgi:hypothetical protein
MKPKFIFASSSLCNLLSQLFFLMLSVINNHIWIMCLLIDHGNESWFRGVRIYILSGSFEPFISQMKYQVAINLVVCRR